MFSILVTGRMLSTYFSFCFYCAVMYLSSGCKALSSTAKNRITHEDGELTVLANKIKIKIIIKKQNCFGQIAQDEGDIWPTQLTPSDECVILFKPQLH
jgi:hypothetical protein